MRLGAPPQSHRPHSRRAKFCAHVCARHRGHNHNGPVRLSAPIRKAILSALSERDETAAICRDKGGNPEPDPEFRDGENVPLRPPRPLGEVEADIRTIVKDIMGMLAEVTGGRPE
jgi:hypothetical protein